MSDGDDSMRHVAREAGRWFDQMSAADQEVRPEDVWKCVACQDTGYVTVQVPAKIYGGQLVDTCVRCVCEAGVSRGRKVACITEFWSPAQMAAAWPNGVPEVAEYIGGKLEAAGWGRQQVTWTLDSYKRDVARADQRLRGYVHYADVWIKTAPGSRSDVLLYGPNGTGKTGLAVAMARGVFELGQTVRLASARDLMLLWRETMKDGGPSEAEAFEPYRTCDVFVLDEVSGTKMTEFVTDSLTALVDFRQKANRATIITINVSKMDAGLDSDEMLKNLFGPALFDRMKDNSQFWPLFGVSKRGQKKKAVAG